MSIEEKVQSEVDTEFSKLDSFEQSRVLRYGEENKEWMMRGYYLNNFYTFFIDPIPGAAADPSRRGWLNRPYADLTVEEFIKQNKFSSGGHSQLYLSQTHHQILSVVDQTVLELGLDPQRLRELSHHMCDGPFGATISATDKKELVKQFLFPIYVKLREKGYSYHDLV